MKEFNCIAYVRVSTENQEDNTSLECQASKITAYCNLYGYALTETRSEVGSGGSIKGRKVFSKLLDDVLESKSINAIIVAKLDRAFRNSTDLLNTVKALKDKGKCLIVIDDRIDTSDPSNDLMLGILGSFAQFENDRLKQRIREGVAKTAQNQNPITESEVMQWKQDKNNGMSVRGIASKYNRHKTTVQRNFQY